MIQLYKAGDKVMLRQTGEVFTVVDDLSYHKQPGILVAEIVGRMFMHWEVRPAGHTRQRRDAAIGITEPEPL